MCIYVYLFIYLFMSYLFIYFIYLFKVPLVKHMTCEIWFLHDVKDVTFCGPSFGFPGLQRPLRMAPPTTMTRLAISSPRFTFLGSTRSATESYCGKANVIPPGKTFTYPLVN